MMRQQECKEGWDSARSPRSDVPSQHHGVSARYRYSMRPTVVVVSLQIRPPHGHIQIIRILYSYSLGSDVASASA